MLRPVLMYWLVPYTEHLSYMDVSKACCAVQQANYSDVNVLHRQWRRLELSSERMQAVHANCQMSTCMWSARGSLKCEEEDGQVAAAANHSVCCAAERPRAKPFGRCFPIIAATQGIRSVYDWSFAGRAPRPHCNPLLRPHFTAPPAAA